jgi:hypothetical protein
MAKQQPKHSGTSVVSHAAKSTDKWAVGRVQDTFNSKTRVRWFDMRTEKYLRTLT